jgi:long-chain fatty acid transport protein
MGHSRLGAALMAGLVGGVSQAASAAGFALIEHGVSGLGTAYAGGAAAALDPTTVFFNPAGMTRLAGSQVAVGANFIDPDIEFSNAGSSRRVGAAAPSPIAPAPGAGPDGGDAGSGVLVPSFYLTHQLDDRWTLGLSVDAPFGLKTEYDRGWVGRYHAINSEIRTVNLNPSVAWKAAPGLSLGAGFSVLYADVELSQAVDSCAFAPFSCDTHSELSGDDVGYGFNLGLLYEISDQTRIGLAYRSRVELELEGEAEFTFDPLASLIPVAPGTSLRDLLATPVSQGGQGLVDGTEIAADLTLPDSLSLSAYHAFSPAWAVMGDITWTQWRLVDTIGIDFDSGARRSLDLDYTNSFRYGLGVTYTPTPAWTWRVGVAYDEEPVRNEYTRTPRLPGNDRLWLAFGASWTPREDLTIDFGYAHLFVDDAEVENTVESVNQVTGAVTATHTLEGKYDLAVDLVGLQATWRFR